MEKLRKVHCKNCGRLIFRSARRFNENIKLGNNFYCSKKCEYEYKTDKKILKCEKCGTKFVRQPSKISHHNYCSRSCAATINNEKCSKRCAELKICEHCNKGFRKSTNNKKYCSQACRRRAVRRTPEDLIKVIRESAKRLKRVPSKREMGSIDDCCRKVFGSWNNAVLASGLVPNRSHAARMYKRINAVATDGHLCDSISELLIDNWLTKNEIKHERSALYPDTNHRADWGILVGKRKILVEYFGLANDSPRYDRVIQEKIKLCAKNKIALISIYPKNIYPKELLEVNLRNKFKDILLT